eukprot:CAMPEP_0119570102 /NCGR_PEP_ID=MMETSP1352-20130426/43444_1 /TAXON_ID=265584 /ORGANISM="Stauroneis constricta, Strain CCMP1120" /LENGTH=859 /DNA_ID=CAMNT_0007619767 /DNA_START=157 /DNA_END=2736 /DNA_ORIENTATION=+
MSDLSTLLVRASQADQQAEQTLKEHEQRDYPGLAQQLAAELATEGKPANARVLSALMLKNHLAAKDDTLQTEKHNRWKSLDPAVRNNIKDALLAAMRSPEAQIPHYAAVAAAEVASVELPYNEWPAFVQTMLENATGAQFPDPVKVATLECLGYTCERIAGFVGVPEITEHITNQMLTAIVDAIQASRPDNLRLAAAVALRNSLGFCSRNMERKEERDAIMNTVCEATRSQHPGVRGAAYDCIVQVAVQYYGHIQEYMTKIYELTTDTIKNDAEEDVAKAAIEFWSSLCETEQYLIDEAADRADQGLPAEQESMRYVNAALEHLVPILTETLTKQDEDGDEDSFNLHMAGHICLTLVSQTVEDEIVPILMPFVEQNIQNENWRVRDAAIMAFTSMLDGPSPTSIGQYVSSSIPMLLNMFQDPVELVRDTAVHCVARICLLHAQSVPHELFDQLLQALVAMCAKGTPRIANQACTAIHNLSTAVAEATPSGEQSNLLSRFMQTILQTLIQVCDRPDAEDSKLRVTAMQCISALISNSAPDVKPLLAQLLPAMIDRLNASFALQALDSSDAEKKGQLQGLLCAILQVLFQKLDPESLMPHCDRVMENLLRVLDQRNTSCQEEAFAAIAAVADCTEANFARYMSNLKPFLIAALRNFQAYQLCIIAVTTIGDISRAIEGQIQPYCDEIMGSLLECLKDSSVHRSVKPPVLSCFGDIAMAIGSGFEPYLQFSGMLLMQASQTTAPPDDEDLVEYFNQLHESILEAYTGIIQAMRDGNCLEKFGPFLGNVSSFLQAIAISTNRDDMVLNKAVGLLGDVAHQFGPEVKASLKQQPFVQTLLDAAMASGDPSMIDTATWAKQVIHS